jgi:hypothetical protein
MRKFICSLAVAGCLAVVGDVALASSISLDALILDHGSVSSGDKLFSDFFYSNSDGLLPSSGIMVDYSISSGGNYGIEFTGTGVAPAFSISGANVTANAALGYTVTVTDPAALITDGHLTITGGVTGAQSYAFISETLDPLTGAGKSMTAYYNVGGDQTSDSVDLDAPGTTEVGVTKNLSLQDGGDPSDSSTVATIGQFFSQSVPEPGVIAMCVGAGFTGLLALRRRK